MSRKSRHRRPSHKRRDPRHVIIARGDRIKSFELKRRWLFLGVLLVGGAVGGAAYGAQYLLDQQAEEASLAAASAEAELRSTYETTIAEVRAGYDQQIAGLSQQVGNLTAAAVGDRTAIEQQIAEIAERQASLNERQQLLTGLADEAFAVGLDVLPALAPLPPANPLRVNGGGPILTPPPAIGGPIDPITTGAIDLAAPFDPAAALAEIQRAASVVENDQMAALDELAEEAETRVDRLASALESLGYNPSGGVGGPLIPMEAGHEDIGAVANDLADLIALQAYAERLPLRQPLAQMSISSNFGGRRDPFTGQTAMHSGLDLIAATGTAVKATAPGRVVFAGTNGGYGRMVEIDHGNGISTAYGHLNSISVSVGDTVIAGEVIARSGSTGRSTGPHLHYEIRRNDRAIDPLPHVRAGQRIADLL